MRFSSSTDPSTPVKLRLFPEAASCTTSFDSKFLMSAILLRESLSELKPPPLTQESLARVVIAEVSEVIVSEAISAAFSALLATLSLKV